MVGMRAGERGRWGSPPVVEAYKRVGRRGPRGRPGGVIVASATATDDPTQVRERRRVLVEGVGEVEVQEWLVVTSKDKKLVLQRRLISTQGGKQPERKE